MSKSFKEMDVVERIKTICSERGIGLSKLERECGFANAYISGLRKGTMPADRLEKVANALGISYWYLLTGESDGYYINPDTAEMAQKLYDRKDIRMLFDAVQDLTEDQVRILQQMADSWNIKG